jgi:hypothetical protein
LRHSRRLPGQHLLLLLLKAQALLLLLHCSRKSA